VSVSRHEEDAGFSQTKLVPPPSHLVRHGLSLEVQTCLVLYANSYRRPVNIGIAELKHLRSLESVAEAAVMTIGWGCYLNLPRAATRHTASISPRRCPTISSCKKTVMSE
jgi:hypothetical protein